MELAVGKESWVLHLVPADGGAVTVTGARLTPAAERSELTDKVVLAFFVFVVAVVVSLIRTALFPAVKKSPAPATAQQLRQAKKAFVPGVAG
ncbi:hypothetical protein DIPPA_00459 [Diplonema papillatum]|nr:hypothetical protein DIPPA_00459 [Diplonema papillatum]